VYILNLSGYFCVIYVGIYTYQDSVNSVGIRMNTYPVDHAYKENHVKLGEFCSVKFLYKIAGIRPVELFVFCQSQLPLYYRI